VRVGAMPALVSLYIPAVCTVDKVIIMTYPSR